MDKLTESKFLMFENEKNNCWLDASVALISHNRTFKKIVGSTPRSQINKIISIHDAAVSILNDLDSDIEHRMKRTREMLLEIQSSTLKYLHQFLKYKVGEPDSAFCALLNLVYQDKSDIKEHLNISWFWKKLCTNCGNCSKSGPFVKPIITLSKVNGFQPECPTSIYMCSCKTEQEMKLVYKELPSCLIFHFENGAGDDEKFPLTFTVKEREYQLTGVIILEKSNDPNLNHFITWIRDPFVNMWLDCNDLNTSIVSFSSKQPEWNLKDVYMCVFESFDNLGKVSNEISADQDQDIENLNVEVIDLSDEAEEAKNASENPCNKNITSKFCQSIKNTTSESYSNTGVSKEVELVSKGDKSANTSNKMHVISKETEKKTIAYSKLPVSNLKFSFSNWENENSLEATKLAFESECRSFKTKEKVKDEPKKVEIKDMHNHSSGAKNVCPLDRNKENKNTSVELLSEGERQQPLLDNLFKATDKPNFKSASSDTTKKLNIKECSSTEKRIPIHSMVKDVKLVKSELGSFQRNQREGQLTRNEHNHLTDFQKSVENASTEDKQRIINTNFQKEKRETICSRLQVKKQKTSAEQSRKVLSGCNTMIHSESGHPTSTVSTKECHEKSLDGKYFGHQLSQTSVEDTAGSETDDSETCDYDENELQLKMQQTSLKRIENQSASSSRRGKVLGANQQANDELADATVSKTAVQKSPRKTSKSKNPNYNTRTGGKWISNKEQDLKNIDEEITEQSNRVSPADEVKDKNASRDTTMEQRLEEVVENVVESVFFSFMEQINLKHKMCS